MKVQEMQTEPIDLFCADVRAAFDVAMALLNNGYMVQVGPTYMQTKGVRIRIWVPGENWKVVIEE